MANVNFMAKRYTIFNMYIRGSNQSPQACHALNNLWKKSNDMSNSAKSLFLNWAENSEIEIMLQGGDHESLEDFYFNLAQIEGVPSAKFNESQRALAGACTVVTFVANEKIVNAINLSRDNKLNRANINEFLPELFSQKYKQSLTTEEMYLVANVAFLPLAN